MPSKKNVSLTGGLGVRYGKRIRAKISEVEVGIRRKYNCQSCGSRTVKRVSVGIWKCRKCGFIFAGAAYSPYSEPGETAKRNIRKGI